MHRNFYRFMLPVMVLTGTVILAADGLDTTVRQIAGGLEFRALGPYRCGSWVTGFAVPESPVRGHRYTFYVATRNGGIWKTVNNGTTFEPVFDRQGTLSIGCVALAPAQPQIVWAGTGEAYNARSSTHGDGVYCSGDGGKTWEHRGLADTHHIARIVIHPQDSQIVYVAAMGHLFSTNAERGVFRTTDGGKSWMKVLFIDEKTGVTGLVMHPRNPAVLYAAAYEMERRPWHFTPGGPGSGIYRTADGGQTWHRLTGGLPDGNLGRIGLDISLSNPDLLMAVVENCNPRPPAAAEAEADRQAGREPAGRQTGGEVYRSTDGGNSWQKVNTGQEPLASKAPYSFNQLFIDPENPLRLYITGVTLANSTDGGQTWHDADWPAKRIFAKAFGDVRTLWIDPQDPERILFGSDGGVYISYDGGKTCDHLNNLPLGEFYAVGADLADPYNLYGGLQDHDSWKGPVNGPSGEVTLADWYITGGQDGMFNVVDPESGRWVYNSYQFGGQRRVDQQLGTVTDIQPRREKDQPRYRFNWTPPLLLSPHNAAIVYTGAEVLLRSLDRGGHWEEISPDLTTNHPERRGDGRGSISFCTITAIAESPLRPGLLWAGTDDGKVWVSRNSGAQWQDCTAAAEAAGAPADAWVSDLWASAYEEGTVWLAKNRFRQDDDRSFLLKSTDYGKSWQLRVSGLPAAPVNAVVQDGRNPMLFFAGTDRGLFFSLDGGASWQSPGGKLPPVKVTDLLIHSREQDLVVATYGRGLYVTDITPLQQLTAEAAGRPWLLFTPRPKAQRLVQDWGNYSLTGDRVLATPNEPEAIPLRYWLAEKLADPVKLTITGRCGEILQQLDGPAEAGFHTVWWDMREKPPAAGSRPAGRAGRLVEPGEYGIILEIGKERLDTRFVISKRTGWSIGPFPVTVPKTIN